jgi:hypothetical protein
MTIDIYQKHVFLRELKKVCGHRFKIHCSNEHSYNFFLLVLMLFFPLSAPKLSYIFLPIIFRVESAVHNMFKTNYTIVGVEKWVLF